LKKMKVMEWAEQVHDCLKWEDISRRSRLYQSCRGRGGGLKTVSRHVLNSVVLGTLLTVHNVTSTNAWHDSEAD